MGLTSQAGRWILCATFSILILLGEVWAAKACFESSHIAVQSLGAPFPMLQRAPRCHSSFLWDAKGIRLDKSCSSPQGDSFSGAAASQSLCLQQAGALQVRYQELRSMFWDSSGFAQVMEQ